MATSGLPTARHHFPPGTPAEVCIAHNRACKVARIVATALQLRLDDTHTDAQMDAVADAAGVNPPGSQETRDAVRHALGEPITADDPNKDFWYAVTDTTKGLPFRYRDDSGRTVLLVPIPVDR
jgi:outer membrane protein assembly factor BamE (lipoprotein component of BamABCDE complex)